MELTPLRPTPNSDITPDSYHKGNHCESCSWTFKLKHVYHNHLKRVYKMAIPHKMTIPRKTKTKPNHDIVPDIDDPNYYCKSCQKSYKSNSKYCNHLRSVHRMKLSLLRGRSEPTPTISIDAIPKDPQNKTCVVCQKALCNVYSYRHPHEDSASNRYQDTYQQHQ